MHAHLGDRQHRKRDRYARLPYEIGASDKERGRRQQNREPQSGQITDDPLCYATTICVLVARRDFIVPVGHFALPCKYTTVNTAIQMMSSACQNSAKHRMRRKMSGLNPLVKTCAIMVSSHRMPAETCSP